MGKIIESPGPSNIIGQISAGTVLCLVLSSPFRTGRLLRLFFQRPGGDTVLRRGFDPFIVETLMEVALVFTIQMLICVEHCLLHHVLHFNRQS